MDQISMIEWQWPWAFYLLPLPLLVYWLLPAVERNEAALKVPDLSPWGTQTHSQQTGMPVRPSAGIIPALIWALLVAALAQPKLLGDVVELPVSGRDLMMAVDISGSMDIEDMNWGNKPVNRLFIVKRVLNDFIAERQGDRLGLVLFGSQAYLQAPLTFDLRTIQTLLDEAEIGLAGKKTAIGDAIGLTIKRLQNNPEQSRVVILLTDGANTDGEVEPLKAAQLAQQSGVKIYTIGLGSDVMEVPSFFGSRQINPSRDLDEASLKKIATATGGQYFRARDTEELKQIYALIQELEPTEKDPEIFRPKKSMYHWLLAGALMLSFLLALGRSSLLRQWIGRITA